MIFSKSGKLLGIMMGIVGLVVVGVFVVPLLLGPYTETPTTITPPIINSTITPIITSENVFTTSYQGDIGSKINQANAACGSTACHIIVNENGGISTQVILSENRVLEFGAYTYDVNATINLSNNDELKGQGSNTIFLRNGNWYAGKEADIRTDPPSDFNSIVYAYMIKVNGADRVTIRDLSIDGNSNQIGHVPIEECDPTCTGLIYNYPKARFCEIFISSSSNVIMDSIHLYNLNNGAIATKGTTDLTISNNEIELDGWNISPPIWTGQQPNNVDIKIINNYIHNASHEAIFLSSVSGGIVEGNRILHNRQNTFWRASGGTLYTHFDVHDVMIVNNTIADSGFVPVDKIKNGIQPFVGHGLEMHGYNLQILGNTIINNSGDGIRIKNNDRWNEPPAHDITIKGNLIQGNDKGYMGARDVPIYYEAGVDKSTILSEGNIVS